MVTTCTKPMKQGKFYALPGEIYLYVLNPSQKCIDIYRNNKRCARLTNKEFRKHFTLDGR